MKLKTVEVGGTLYAEVADGRPVYVHDDGREVPFDAARTVAKIGELNREAQTHREAKEAAETRLKAFEGIDDAEAARKALATLKNLDDKKLVDAGEVERIKAEAIKAVEDKWRPVSKERDALKDQLHREIVGGSFARSKFIGDRLAIPADLAEAAFGRNFSVEDGRIVAKDGSGKPIYSPTRPGELADFDEAMETLVAAYPHRDSILRGANQTGSGAKPSAGGATGGKTITRAEFDKLSPADKFTKMSEQFQVVDAA
ncbi:DUF6651 domain-containing protein [Roseomonas chloroacetimidivorans]|uniref:DUF6651 domain-containing protein n=1 Tax=Roseomonas chloroacetimidivorans TaxID=1766656 RepID=UPI003C72389B